MLESLNLRSFEEALEMVFEHGYLFASKFSVFEGRALSIVRGDDAQSCKKIHRFPNV